jgi:hypothetical protein
MILGDKPLISEVVLSQQDNVIACLKFFSARFL